MDCSAARSLILESERPPVDGPLADHLRDCASCQRLVGEVAELEAAWRNLPLPEPAGEGGAERFLRAHPRTGAAPGRPVRRRRLPLRWLATAASILAAAALWAGFAGSVPRVQASSDVVERLVEWNLELAGAPTEERERIFGEQAGSLTNEVQAAKLDDDDRELARALLDGVPRIARGADPLFEADRFDRLADQLFRRISHASKADDAPRVKRFARLYQRVVELGIEPRMQLLEASAALDFDHQRRLERLILRDADRMETLVALLEQSPDSSRKEIKQALGIARRTPKVKAPRPEGGKKPRIKDKDKGIKTSDDRKSLN